jgi:hypothetical protein
MLTIGHSYKSVLLSRTIPSGITVNAAYFLNFLVHNLHPTPHKWCVLQSDHVVLRNTADSHVTRPMTDVPRQWNWELPKHRRSRWIWVRVIAIFPWNWNNSYEAYDSKQNKSLQRGQPITNISKIDASDGVIYFHMCGIGPVTKQEILLKAGETSTWALFFCIHAAINFRIAYAKAV